MMRRQQDQHSRVLHELSSMVLNIIRSPPTPIEFNDESPADDTVVPGPSAAVAARIQPILQQITPAGFASFLLGISLALMLCGSVTFFIGFMMMPWVLGLAMVLYFVGVVASLSMLGRTILCHLSSSSRKDAHYSEVA
ncbi:PREDICTED: uncharacterized protein LOC109176157 isoform X2 [Ipomoea nil]|uniref:uncharacterized protein LOC109176157 isoform X2 n=1 Tax=Ipomoea nil TaxID=35883 RepID=UPI000900FBD2|nr:PREDICTED: uncharacterized protein LOC109176157 isoform X2 [Ipomoea nil]